MQSGFQCSYCGEWNVTEVDESAGASQDFVEDCQVCCQPNVLQVRFNRNEQRFTVRAEREN
jgi:Cysteine-rich CPXCG